MGPSRTGVIPGVRLARDWAAHPPKLIWKIPVGAGWSGFAIDRGLAITQEQRGAREMVVAYDLLTGAPRWSHGDTIRYDSVIAGDGPRATPTIAGPYVATLGSTGWLNVLDFRTGRRLWSKDIAADNKATNPEWGRSGSPLILDGKVIVSAGGGDGKSLVAYDARTGARVWSGGSDDSAYASPILMTLLGRPQVVIMNRVTLAGHDPATGALLWSQPWVLTPNVAMPIRVADDLVLGSTGYGIGSKLVRLTPGAEGAITSAFVWETPRLKAKFTNPVLRDGFVYGLDDGVLVCMDVTTGERRWRAGRYGHGQTLLVGDVLLVTTEDGEIVLVEATPEAHREVARFTVFDGKTWNPPAIAGKVPARAQRQGSGVVRTDAGLGQTEGPGMPGRAGGRLPSPFAQVGDAGDGVVEDDRVGRDTAAARQFRKRRAGQARRCRCPDGTARGRDRAAAPAAPAPGPRACAPSRRWSSPTRRPTTRRRPPAESGRTSSPAPRSADGRAPSTARETHPRCPAGARARRR